MSVEVRADLDGKIVLIDMSGKLTKEDYHHFVPEVDRLIQKHGKVRMLVRMHDFHGWKLAAVWEDTKFGLRHFSAIERLAIVGEKAWEHGMAIFCRPFTRAEIRYFDQSKAEEAEAWIHDGFAAPTVQAEATSVT